MPGLVKIIRGVADFWDRWGYITLIILAIGIILGLALFRIGKKGTFSKSYYYPRPFDIRRARSSGSASSHTSLRRYDNTISRRPARESKGEKECRRVLEEIFRRPFSSVRPSFLRNPVTSSQSGSTNLEIDCFNAELKLGVEYNGAQHYKYIPHFHKNKEAFRNQQYRDLIKRTMCEKNGVTLIEVPHTVKHDDIAGYLRDELRQQGFLQ